MSVKVYEINGEWLTWDHLHNVLGYTMTPSVAVSYKSAAHDTWGEDAGNGYALNSDGELSQWSMWSEGIVGWFGANGLAEQGAYPASSANLFLERTGETAKAVSLDDGVNTYYLIDGYLDLGWRLWEVLEAEGWQISNDGELAFIVVDEETGTIVHSIVDEGMVYGDVGYVLMDEASNMITVYETGVKTESFYFTTNGRNETENTQLPIDSAIPLYWEDGSRVDDTDGIATEYDGSRALALTKVDGNTFKTSTYDQVVSEGDNLDFYGDDITDNRFAWSVQVEYIEPAPHLPTVSTSGDFGSNNWLYTNTQGQNVSVASNSTANLVWQHDGSSTAAAYDSTKSYAIIRWSTFQGASGSGRTEFGLVNNTNGNLYAKNLTSAMLQIYALRCAVCSDSSETVVTVYNSSDGAAYNAFKYTVSGTDYYYVLDETQTDWSDDLTSIGYSLEPPAPSEYTAYFTNQGAAETSNYLIGNGASGVLLYDGNGALIDVSAYMAAHGLSNYDPLPWTITGYYNVNDESVTVNWPFKLSADSGKLILYPFGTCLDTYQVFKLTYTES